jgi:hypothetical protein
MMPWPLFILAAYALTFAVQNDKIWGICHLIQRCTESESRVAHWVIDLVNCTFCTGFHAGWIVWLLGLMVWTPPLETGLDLLQEAVRLFLMGLVSSAACYAMDEAVATLEHVRGHQPEDEEPDVPYDGENSA